MRHDHEGYKADTPAMIAQCLSCPYDECYDCFSRTAKTEKSKHNPEMLHSFSLFEKGLSPAQASQETGVPMSTMKTRYAYWRQEKMKQGIKVQRTYNRTRGLKPEVIESRKLFEEGYTNREVADKLGEPFMVIQSRREAWMKLKRREAKRGGT